MAGFKLKISEKSTEAIPTIMGVSFIQCFCNYSDVNATSTFVLQLPRISDSMRIFLLVIRWILLIFLPVALVQDFTDLAVGVFQTHDLQTNYGKAEPVIALMTYCSTHMALFMAIYTVIFLVVKRTEILKTCSMVQEITTSLQIKMCHVRTQLRLLRVCFWTVLLLGLSCLVCTVSDPRYYQTFPKLVQYGYIPTRQGLLSLYFRGTIFYCTMIHYTIQGLFAYINVFLLACSDEITRQQAEFLDVYKQELGSGEIIAHQAQVSILSKPEVAIASKKISSEVYLEKVKLWLEYNEELKNTFDQVQKTFSWKLLFDTATLCLGLFMQLAYISTWLLKPTTDLSTVGIVVNLIRHIVYLVTYLLCGWIVLYRPLSLYKMHHNRSDVMGKILAERRRSSCEEPSNEEILLSMIVMKKTDDGGLVYKAGTILPLGPKVVCTISAAVFAFGWFVIQRSLDFKAKL